MSREIEAGSAIDLYCEFYKVDVTGNRALVDPVPAPTISIYDALKDEGKLGVAKEINNKILFWNKKYIIRNRNIRNVEINENSIRGFFDNGDYIFVDRNTGEGEYIKNER